MSQVSEVQYHDEAVLFLFKQCIAMNVPITGPLMKQKATALAREMEIADWEASDGWLHRFKNRHVLAFKTVCGESASVTPEMVKILGILECDTPIEDAIEE